MQSYLATLLPGKSHIARLPDGGLLCKDVVVARSGPLEYLAQELELPGSGRVTVWRPPEEVTSRRFLASCEGAVVTDEHPSRFVDRGNFQIHARGHSQNARVGPLDDKGNATALVDLFINDDGLAQKVESGAVRDISIGYNLEVVKDAIGRWSQRNLRVNHVAVVKRGRAKSTKIMDSAPVMGIVDMAALYLGKDPASVRVPRRATDGALGQGLGSAVKGLGKGVGSAGAGVGEGIGNAARGVGEAVKAVGHVAERLSEAGEDSEGNTVMAENKWKCSCGNINHTDAEDCAACGAAYDEQADELVPVEQGPPAGRKTSRDEALSYLRRIRPDVARRGTDAQKHAWNNLFVAIRDGQPPDAALQGARLTAADAGTTTDAQRSEDFVRTCAAYLGQDINEVARTRKERAPLRTAQQLQQAVFDAPAGETETERFLRLTEDARGRMTDQKRWGS